MNFDRKVIKVDDEGVSEIVGTILTLSITVVLFSSIFAGIQYIETPEGSTFAEFSASYDQDDFITIEHNGGKDLKTFKTSILVLVEDKSWKYDFGGPKINLLGEDSKEWETGEKVRLNIKEPLENVTDDNLIRLMVLDTSRSQVVWRSEVDVYVPTKITPKIKSLGVVYPQEWDESVEAGDKCKLYVDVNYTFSKIGDIKVLVNLNVLKGFNNSGAWGTSWHNMSYQDGYRFTRRIELSATQNNKSYLLEVAVHNDKSNDSITRDFVENGNKDNSVEWAKSDYIGLNIGPHGDISERPDVVVDENKIDFLPASPTNGDSFTTRAVIENGGGTSAIVDVYFNDTGPDNNVVNQGIVEDVRIAAGGGRDVSATWTINTSGLHNINVSVANIRSVGGEDLPPPNNNWAEKPVYVAPTILLVDDDHEDDGEASIMKGALSGADFTYEYYEVKGKQGPPYDKMEKYDIVIWMTGRSKNAPYSSDLAERQPTLTAGDQDNLKKYLENENMVWLIGEGIVNDGGGTFLSSLNMQYSVSDMDNYPDQSDLRINGTGILENTSYPIYDRTFEGDKISPSGNTKSMITNDEGSGPLAITYENKDPDYKIAFNSFLFSSMRAGHSTMAYKVIKWLGNMTEKSGHDLAVSDQEFSTRAPMFKDRVRINATIRNNGQFEETADVRLFIDGQLDTTQIETVTIGPGGNYTEVSFNWTAEPVGEHELLVRVDPFDKIEETNELNNDITYQDYDATIAVQYSVLVVDDDGTKGIDNTTSHVVNQLDKLGYLYDYVDLQDESIPTVEDMSEYNSIFWVTGKSSNPDFTSLTAINEVKNYLNNYSDVSLFLEGGSILQQLNNHAESAGPGDNPYSEFITEYLGIDNKTINLHSDMDHIKGKTGDGLSHGMDYEMDVSNSYQNFSVENGVAIFKNEHNQVVGIRNHNQDRNFKTVSLGFDISNIYEPDVEEDWYSGFREDVTINAEPAREEFVYMMTKWFGNEDQRTELRVSEVDIDIETENPMLGKSYLITAKIQNIGFKGSGALVRFKDGDSLIASESIYIDGDETQSVEINWEPLFAGYNDNETDKNTERNITVLVDPLCEVDEIGNNETSHDHMNFNNVDVKRTPVYYFWDDMESGAENWKHESVLANINGESPIDYLGGGYQNVYTDVISHWNTSGSTNWTGNMTEDFSHTNPYSFRFSEPKPQNATIEETTVPVDIVFVLDTSGSMDGDRWRETREATINFLQDKNLTSRDRVAIYRFHPNGYATPYLMEPASFMTDSNKSDFIADLQDIDDYDPTGGTPFYDTLGQATNYLLSPDFTDDSGGNIPADADCSNHDRLEFVVGMTDGHSNSDETWTPNTEWGNTIYDDEYGSYTEKIGLLKAPPMMYTMGMVDPDLNDGSYPSISDDLTPDWRHEPEHDGDPTDEFDLWNVADKSGWPWGKYGRDYNSQENIDSNFEDPDPYFGHYYYVEQAEDIGTVFSDIRNMISNIAKLPPAEVGNVTSLPINDIKSSGSNTVINEDSESLNDNSLKNSVIFKETFSGTTDDTWEGDDDGETDPSDEYWTVAQDDSDPHDIQVGELSSYPGYSSNCVEFHDCDQGWGSQYMETTIDLSAYTTVIISFNVSGEGNEDGNGWRFEVDPEGDGTFNSPIFEEFGSQTNHDWQNYRYTVPNSDISSSYTIRFNANSDHYSDEVWFDDIKVYLDVTPPDVIKAYPTVDSIALPTQYVSIIFDESMKTSSIPDISQINGEDIGDYTFEGWFTTNIQDDTAIYSHENWTFGDTITLKISNYFDKSNNKGVPYTWTFDIIEGGIEEAEGKNRNKTAVTPSFDLTGYSRATLTFWHKYNIVPGANGAFIQVGYLDGGKWTWNYTVPVRGTYTGNMDMDVNRTDSLGHEMDWCWNGVSGGGTFTWDYVRMNILDYVPEDHRNNVSVKFNYIQYGAGTGYGWYFDDIKIIGSRTGHNSSHIDSKMMDVWQLNETRDANNNVTTAWWNGYYDGSHHLKRGIDNSLISNPIDLTRAQIATLQAHFKFNLNHSAGAPPDGFRIEISTDNGVTWMPINDGVRSAMGLSGSDNTGKTSYTGHDIGYNWVTARSLTRLNVDLSAFSGETILIRFRMVTNTADNYQHYDVDNDIRGFYIDNVMVTGRSIQG